VDARLPVRGSRGDAMPLPEMLALALAFIGEGGSRSESVSLSESELPSRSVTRPGSDCTEPTEAITLGTRLSAEES